MAITTYSELKTAVANWLSRADQTSRIEDYIALAEAGFYQGRDPLRVAAMQSRSTGTTASASIALPTGYLETLRLSVSAGGSDYALEYANPVLFAGYETQAGYPTYYTLLNGALKTAPNNDVSYTHDYYARLTALSDADPTNWLLTNAPNVYLYGALAEAYRVLKDDNRAAQFDALLRQALSGVNQAERSKFESHGMMVMLA